MKDLSDISERNTEDLSEQTNSSPKRRQKMSHEEFERLTNNTRSRIATLESLDNTYASADISASGLQTDSSGGIIMDNSWLACNKAMIKKEKELYVQAVHKHKIWQQPNKSLWTTYLKKDSEKYSKITSKTYDGLILKLYDYYSKEEVSTVLKDLWPKVMKWKSRSVKAKSLKIYDGYWKKFFQSDPISEMRIKDIDLKAWRNFFDRIIEKFGLTKSQFSNVRTVANYLVKYAIWEDILDRNPVSDLAGVDFPFRKAPAYNSVKAPHFDDAALEKIRLWCDNELKNPRREKIYALAIKFNVSYGTRIGELSGLFWSDIDFDSRTFVISHQYVAEYEYCEDGKIKYAGKSDTDEVKGYEEPRLLPLTDEAVEILEQVKALNLPGEHVFPVRYNTYNDRIKELAKALDLDPKAFRSHSLRTTAARHVYKKTGDVKVVQSLLGHTTPTMTFKYIKNFDNTEVLRNVL